MYLWSAMRIPWWKGEKGWTTAASCRPFQASSFGTSGTVPCVSGRGASTSDRSPKVWDMGRVEFRERSTHHTLSTGSLRPSFLFFACFGWPFLLRPQFCYNIPNAGERGIIRISNFRSARKKRSARMHSCQAVATSASPIARLAHRSSARSQRR